MRLDALNYYGSVAAVSTKPFRLHMRPISVSGTILSAFTHKGVSATFTGKVDGQTASNGTFTVYGIGPGDELTISAFGHETTSATVDNARRIDVTLALGKIDPRSVFTSVTGLTYEDAPPSIVAQLRGQMRTDPLTDRVVTVKG